MEGGYALYTPDDPKCDARDRISQRLRDSGFENVDEHSIAATVDHWFSCNCDVTTFLRTYPDTYPKNAIQLKATNMKVQQVLPLLRLPQAQAPRASTSSLRSAPTAHTASAASTSSLRSTPTASAASASPLRSAPTASAVSAFSIRSTPAASKRAPKKKRGDERDESYEYDWRDDIGWAAAARELEVHRQKERLDSLEHES